MSSGSETTKTGQQETAARGSSRGEMSEQEAGYQARDNDNESDEETPDIMPDRILSPEEAEADYQAQLALLCQQTAEYEASQQAAKENGK
ncbi:hypothetical protein EsDP_00007361 [Epichloe bromicola]|uniref:Uncharacterized protein n=1 Tax=Epichloe bromicola TaxID=79588 RepID=A0ABQ0D0P5_9HYPO